MWFLRKLFWNVLAVSKFRGNHPAVFPIPRDGDRKLEVVSLASQFPGIPISNIRVADHVPSDEASLLKYYFYRFQVAMYRLFSPMQAGLPAIDADPTKALAEAYGRSHRACFPGPILPAEYEGVVDLGRVAVASPYAAYVEQSPEGGYQWDLRNLARYEHHDGLYSLGMRVLFKVNEAARKLEAVQIDCELGTIRLGDSQWGLAKKIALCAITTHTSLVRHFNWVHLAAGGPLSIATRNCYPADHPLRRLLWPHIFGTQYSNQVVTQGQMVKGGDFETTFSFTHSGMCKLFADTYDLYTITAIDPARDAERRGLKHAGFDTPALINREAHFDVMLAHSLRYLRLYYSSDSALRADASATAWLDALESTIPNGIRKLMGEEMTIEGLARLIAAFIYLGAVEHEILGTGLWNYQLWTHIQPVRVYSNGQREPLDVYQRLVNSNFNLNVHRAKLVQDFSYLGLDPKGAQAFQTFKSELEQLQGRLDKEPFATWKMYPKILEANINA